MLLEKADTRGLPSLIEAYHDIQGSDGKPFSTFHTVRSGIASSLWESDTGSKTPATAKEVRREGDHDAEPHVHLSVVAPFATVEKYSRLSQTPNYSPVDRIHTQILLPLGIPIKYSKNLLELLGCFLGFMKDDRHAHINGVVHRDVSMGNVFIFFDTGGKAVGRLMDYDHAKRALTSIHIPTEEHEPDMIEMTRTFIARQSRPPIPLFTEEAVVEANVPYAQPVKKIFGGNFKGRPWMEPRGEYSIELFYHSTWSNGFPARTSNGRTSAVVRLVKDIAVKSLTGHQGTLPFMSPEVLLQLPILDTSHADEPFIHTSVHDVESFLWVLVYLCITRRGPGMGMLRQELDPSHMKHDRNGPLFTVVREYFDGDEETVKKSKRKLHLDKGGNLFQTAILDHFHPFFDPLKSLVRDWWKTLVHAYKFRGNEYYHIHDHVIRLLDSAISDLGDDGTKRAQEDTDREVERRATLRENTRQ
ncbi:hypothetical protein DXG03_002942, partial [Asterophora parasitica]